MIAPWKNDKILKAYERPVIRASIEIILSVFTVVLLLLFAIKTTLATVATLQKKIDDQSVVDRKLTTKIVQLSRAQTDLNTYAEMLPEFSTAVPDLADQGGLAKRIELLARDEGLTIENLSFDNVPIIGQLIDLANREKGAVSPTRIAGGIVASFKISFDVSGSQNQIVSFLSKLENMDRLVVIDSIDMKKVEQKTTGAQEKKGAIRVIGTGMAYYALTTKQ